MHRLLSAALLLTAVVLPTLSSADTPPRQTPKEALQVFNDLIGSWRGTGNPVGTREEVQKGFWTETVEWGWQFQGTDAWLTAKFAKGKYFVAGELRYLPKQDLYQLTLQTTAGQKVVLSGPRKEKVLTLERSDTGARETQRLIVNLLHPNRFLYQFEVRPEGKALFRRLYQVGATKEGMPFAARDGKPECVVSGGLGTTAVSYKGRTYYVCCSGCRAEFNEAPEKYIKEYEAKQKAKSGAAPK